MRISQKHHAIWLLLLSLLTVFIPYSIANAEEKILVQQIQITGLDRVEKEAVMSGMAFREKDQITNQQINHSIKNLYATGLFKEVEIQIKEPNTIHVILQENPLIESLVFKGNKGISTKNLLAEMVTKSFSIFSEEKLQNDIKRIKSLYEKSGRFATEVSVKQENLPKNIIKLTLEVQEGSKNTINKIRFVGNKAFDEMPLKGVIKSKENKWYNILPSPFSSYNEDLIMYDKELLREFYSSRGYFDFSVNNVTAETVGKNGGSIELLYDLSEGEVYKVSDVSIISNIKNVTNDDIKSKLYGLEQNTTYNKQLIDSNINIITHYLNNLGYVYATVNVTYNQPKEHALDVVFHVDEGKKISINKINITGNSITYDSTIRRYVLLDEGSVYNKNKIIASRSRLERMPIFKAVTIENKKTDSDDKIDLNIKVEEARTSSLNFSAGYDSSQGLLGMVSLIENNFIGMGQTVEMSMQRTPLSDDINISFYDPRINEQEWFGGFNLFHLHQSVGNFTPYQSSSSGMGINIGKNTISNWRVGINAAYAINKIYDIQPSAISYIGDEAGERTTQTIGYSIGHSNLVQSYYNQIGYSADFYHTIATPIGNNQFIKYEAKGRTYKRLSDDVSLQAILRGGIIHTYGNKEVTIGNRFFVGSNDIRGFDINGIGPRDRNTQDALGGNKYYVTKVQIDKPLNFIKDLELKAGLFIDGGSLFDIDNLTPNIINKKGMRMAAGAGISWVTPMGPMRLDYAFPIIYYSQDKLKRVRFTIGQDF